MKELTEFLEEEIKGINKVDIIVLTIILILYGIISFVNLGDKTSINTFYTAKKEEQLSLKLNTPNEIYRMKFYTGNEKAKFKVYTKIDDEYKYIMDAEGKGSFTWNEILFKEATDEVKIVFNEPSVVGEMAIFDINDKTIPYKIDKTKFLNDEEKNIVKNPSYMNSTYFDEVYFARTAYEYVYGLKLYEWTHPPLGKLIQAIPIYITHNMSPFNYRFMSNISGILIVGVMYVFGAIYFKKRKYAILSSIIMSLDTLHYVQTRMGTIDPHLVLFILLANLFMVLFVKKEKVLYLFTSGIFFALSISVKWTGFYGGISLAIIYFTYLIKNKKINTKYINYGTCFFVIIPIFIYSLWFLIFPNNEYKTNTIKNIVNENVKMYEYHSKVTEEHFYSSKWYTWPISYKPVWLHTEQIDDNNIETISNVGNIVLWYAAIIGVIASIIKVVKDKDKNSFYMIVTILSLWLPYMFINRPMFLYHYYPVLPFTFLSLVNILKDLREKYKNKFAIPTLLIVSLLFFATYYPVVSGAKTNSDYIEKLKLFDTWYF